MHENMLYRIIPKAVSGVVNVEIATPLLITASLVAHKSRKVYNVFIHVPCTKPIKQIGFSMAPNSRNCITTSEGMTKEHVTLLWYLSYGAPALSGRLHLLPAPEDKYIHIKKYKEVIIY